MAIAARTDFDFRDWDNGAKKFLAAAKNLKPVWRKLRPLLKADQIDHFKKQSGPGGKWPKLAKSTRDARLKRSTARANKRGRKPPKRSSSKILGNKMPTAFEITIMRKSIEAASVIEWAAAHQEGAVVGRGAVLPKREHIYLSDRFLRVALREMHEYIVNTFMKGARG